MTAFFKGKLSKKIFVPAAVGLGSVGGVLAASVIHVASVMNDIKQDEVPGSPGSAWNMNISANENTKGFHLWRHMQKSKAQAIYDVALSQPFLGDMDSVLENWSERSLNALDNAPNGDIRSLHPLSAQVDQHVDVRYVASDIISGDQWHERPADGSVPDPSRTLQWSGENPATIETETVDNQTITSVRCDGHNAFSGQVLNLGANENAAAIIVFKPGSGANNGGTHMNTVFAIDNSSRSFKHRNDMGLALFHNTDDVNTYGGYMAALGHAPSSRHRGYVDGSDFENNQINVVTLSVINGITSFHRNGQAVHVDLAVSAGDLPESSDILSICGIAGQAGYGSDVGISEVIVMSDADDGTKLAMDFVIDVSQAIQWRYNVNPLFQLATVYNENYIDTTTAELEACGSDNLYGILSGSSICFRRPLNENDNESWMNVPFPFIGGGATWAYPMDQEGENLPLNRNLADTRTTGSGGAGYHALNGIANPRVILDANRPYNPETGEWKNDFKQRDADGNSVDLSAISENPDNNPELINYIDGSTALVCDGQSLKMQFNDPVGLTDGMTLMVYAQLDLTDQEIADAQSGIGNRVGGIVNLGEHVGYTSGRGIFELRHDMAGNLLESSGGGGTRRISVGNKPFIAAVRLSKNESGQWKRSIHVLPEGGEWHEEQSVHTNIGYIDPSSSAEDLEKDSMYFCSDSRTHGRGNVILHGVYLASDLKEPELPFVGNVSPASHMIYKMARIIQSQNGIMEGNPTPEPPLNNGGRTLLNILDAVPN